MNSLRTALLALMLLALPVAAQAYTITWDNYSVPGVSVTGIGGSLATKSQSGIGSLGISGGVNGEISIGQGLLITFDSPQIVNTLDLSLLYTSGNYGDIGDEVAGFTGSRGSGSSLQVFSNSLTADTPTSGILTGPGSVVNLDPAVENNGALWRITNPFGTQAVTSILLSALDNGIAPNLGGSNTDFGLNALSTTATPIPGSFLLLGAGMVGLGAWRRMRTTTS